MKKKKKKVIIILGVFLAVVLLIGIATFSACAALAKRADANLDMGAEAQILSTQDLSTAISTSGKIESQTVISVASDLTYKIKELPVQLGDYVEAGQVLCVFDDTELKQEIAELESGISESKRLSAKQSEINKRALEDAKLSKQETLAEAQARIDSAKAMYEKLKKAYDAGDTDAYAELTNAEAEYKAAQNAYKQAERSADETIQSCQDAIDTESSSKETSEASKQLAELKRKLEKTTIRAEGSGIITSLQVNQGSVHAGGELMKIQDSSKMKLVVSLTESDVIRVKTGMVAEITANALGDETITGSISKVINFISGSGMSEDGSAAGYSAEILIDEPGNLLLGMNAKARIILEDVGEALAVSYDSIGYDEEGNPYVLRAVNDKDDFYTIEKVPVEVGIEGEYYTQISSDDLAEGDYIMYYPDAYTEGDSVKLNPDFLK